MRELVFIGLIPQPTFNTHPHSHTTWEAAYYNYGEGTMVAGEKSLRFSTGDIICVPPGIVHKEHSENGFMNIHILFGEFKTVSEIITVKDTDKLDILQLLQFMHNEFHLNPQCRHHIPESLLEAIGYYVTSRHMIKTRNFKVELLESLIVSNITRPEFDVESSLADISDTPSYFRKLFKKQTGMTPLQYLTEKRIEYAKKLLETRSDKDMKIYDISLMTGYIDPYYFSRVFKKLTGVSPEAWKPVTESEYRPDLKNA